MEVKDPSVAGTAEYHIGCGVLPVKCTRDCGSKRVIKIMLAPAATLARAEHKRPPMWNCREADCHIGCGVLPAKCTRDCGSKRTIEITLAPAATLARTEHKRPPMWNNGFALKQQSSCRSCKLAPGQPDWRFVWHSLAVARLIVAR